MLFTGAAVGNDNNVELLLLLCRTGYWCSIRGTMVLFQYAAVLLVLQVLVVVSGDVGSYIQILWRSLDLGSLGLCWRGLIRVNAAVGDFTDCYEVFGYYSQ